MTTQPKTSRSKRAKDMAVTWRTLVYGVLENEPGAMTLAEIYSKIEDHPKAKRNRHWQAKIRQVLQRMPQAERVARGVWRLKA